MSHNVLIIEDDQNARSALSKVLARMGYYILIAGTGEKGLEIIEKETVHLVLCDIQLPGIDGLEVLEKIKQYKKEIVVVMMTAFGSIEKAVKAIKMGAMDFIEKPLDLEIIRETVACALKLPDYLKNRDNLLLEAKEKKSFAEMVGASKPMQDIFSTIIKVAPARTTVLITGETGTGKELVARAIHQYSSRSGSFVAVNLSAVTDTLFESELFGYVKGAHSTAFQDRKGRLEEANKGTLFIDEVGDIPETVQVKLLRCIENRTFERLGENSTHKVDVRFVAATNVNMDEVVASGKFRQDLYYRLKVLEIHLPSLRERQEDIPLLAYSFLQKFSQENNRPVYSISKEAMDYLLRYPWPGNIRELENKIEQAVVMAEGDTLLPCHFSPEIQKNQTQVSGDIIQVEIGTSLRDMEREMIQRTLVKVGGNKTKAAEILRIGTRTLYRKIEEYGLDKKDFS
ncbi:MAG: sigma-54-dependent Fis family transcriptional regulator [Candidatus Brocadiae bacterium]|nr:sigma-54-dependent Fis family transcriptional regulator [Candidatus Brocadiia bacterium]